MHITCIDDVFDVVTINSKVLVGFIYISIIWSQFDKMLKAFRDVLVLWIAPTAKCHAPLR